MSILKFELAPGGEISAIYTDQWRFEAFTQTGYYFQDKQISATASTHDSIEYISDNQKMQVKYTFTDRACVDLTACDDQVFCAGFSVCLPKGSIYSFFDSPDQPGFTWEDTEVGEKVYLDRFKMVYGQFILLETQMGVIRIGRQVLKKLDYTTSYFEKHPEGWLLVWRWEPQMPYPSNFTAQQLQFTLFETIQAACKEHGDWAARTFGLKKLTENPKVPNWLHKCKLIFQFVIGETNLCVIHDYFDLCNFIEDIHSFGVPEHTIIYIPDYSQATGIINNQQGPIACFNPESMLYGGKEVFKKAVALAKKYNYHIMPHLDLYLMMDWCYTQKKDQNGNNINWYNPTWKQLEPEHAVRTKKGNPIGWPPAKEEIQGFEEDWDKYPYAVRYLNQSHELVQRMYIDKFKKIHEEYQLDSYYFDSLTVNYSLAQMTCWNSPTHNEQLRDGERKMIQAFYEIAPDILLSGEGCDEETADLAPLWNNRFGIWNMVLGEYGYTFAHTATPTPIMSRFPNSGITHYMPNINELEIEYCKKYPNNIPRLMVNYRDYGLDDLTKKCITDLLNIRR